MDSNLLALAHAQAGALRTAQIEQFLTRSQVRRYVREGVLTKMHPGVWVLPLAPDDLASRLTRLQLCTPEKIVAWGPTAAELHELGPRTTGTLHVSSLRARSLSLPADAVVHQTLLRSEPVRLGTVLVADYWDTAVDLALGEPRGDCLAVLDSALRRTPGRRAMSSAIRRAYGLRGRKLLRELEPHVSGAVESPMESRIRQQIILAGYTDVEVQVEVELPNGRRRLDMGFRRYRIGVEYDGEEFHTGAAMSNDRRRHNEFAATGWAMVHVTKRDCWRPERYLGQLGLILASRGYLRPDARRVASVPRGDQGS